MGSCVSSCTQPRVEYLVPEQPIEHVDIKGVKRRIKSGKLAPFYPGLDSDVDAALDNDVRASAQGQSQASAHSPRGGG